MTATTCSRILTRQQTPARIGAALLVAGLTLTGLALAQAPAPARGAPSGVVPVSPARSALLPIGVYIDVTSPDEAKALAALHRIAQNPQPESAAMLVDLLTRVPHRSVLLQLIPLIERITGQPFDGDVNGLYEWLWSAQRPVHPDYSDFKAALHADVDPRFREYFRNHPRALIRLDEIRWGGVRRDGIPPLKNPKMVSARQASSWLEDDHIVFGVAINGDVRAYPKRILAWHEMFKDRIGGRELAGVYCTLCGALVLYDVTVAGNLHELGTSGYLYRSNKLMYDHATKSLWSTLTGEPVVGPLTGKGIALESLYVVTTTWKEWRTRHPQTTVLSLDTGHSRNYDEGAAYASYFSTDRLMFNVPRPDNRLPNKAEVLALRLPQAPGESLAIAADFLANRPVYLARLGSVKLVILTDASGANRVYERGDVAFASWDQTRTARDRTGHAWRVEEAQLTGPGGQTLKRVSAHRAFWFGWHAAFPDTQLIR